MNRQFCKLPTQLNPPQASNLAWQYFQNHGALTQCEAWRWSKLPPLDFSNLQIENAIYKGDFGDASLGAPRANDELLASLVDAPFAALNIALLTEELTLTLTAAQQNKMLTIDIEQLRSSLQFSRLKIVVAADVETSFCLQINCMSGVQLPLVNIDIGENARVQALLQTTGDGVQLTHIALQLQQNSSFNFNILQYNTAYARLDLQAQLQGENCNFTLGAIQGLTQQQHGDFHVRIAHRKPHCNSKQIIRSTLSGNSFAIFDGLIYVAREAQQTDASQDARAILSSTQAQIQHVPRLEIYADDVQCAHGATTGFVADEELFYLQSRGISAAKARAMLELSFVQQAIVIDDEKLRQRLQATIATLWQLDD